MCIHIYSGLPIKYGNIIQIKKTYKKLYIYSWFFVFMLDNGTTDTEWLAALPTTKELPSLLVASETNYMSNFRPTDGKEKKSV